MKYNPEIHQRRSIRLKGYDYSQNGAYFITLCAQNKECLFGEIVGAGSKPAPTGDGLSEIVRQFKTFSAKRINKLRKTHAVAVWQRNYYEHIIRNEQSLEEIRGYIINNSYMWKQDELFCKTI